MDSSRCADKYMLWSCWMEEKLGDSLHSLLILCLLIPEETCVVGILLLYCIYHSVSQIACSSLPLISFSNILVFSVRSLCVFLFFVLLLPHVHFFFSSSLLCLSFTFFLSRFSVLACLSLSPKFVIFGGGRGGLFLHYLFPFFLFYLLSFTFTSFSSL